MIPTPIKPILFISLISFLYNNPIDYIKSNQKRQLTENIAVVHGKIPQQRLHIKALLCGIILHQNTF
jgi:hypothetical protein